MSLSERSGFIYHQNTYLLYIFKNFGIFKKTPFFAPWLIPTIIDMGVANPNAQGESIINTETAAISP